MKEQKERREQKEKKKFDFERNSRTIFIGNLPSAYDHKDVAKLFKQCGPVESARIRSVIPEKEKMPPKVAEITKRIHPKIDSVNAYLVFKKDDENEQHILKALAMNGKLVDEHHIRVDRAQHPNSKRLTLTSRKKSVFVGNLRFDIRDDDLIKHFEKIAPVDYVRLVRDRATGLGKGFGFVKFKERAPVKEALKLNETQFQGRELRVKKVDEDAPAKAKGNSVKEADDGENKFLDAKRKNEENRGIKRAKIDSKQEQDDADDPGNTDDDDDNENENDDDEDPDIEEDDEDDDEDHDEDEKDDEDDQDSEDEDEDDDDDDDDDEDDGDSAPQRKFKRSYNGQTKRGSFNGGARGGFGRSYSDSQNGRGGNSKFRGGRPGGRGRGGQQRGGSGRVGSSGPFRGGFKSGGFGRGGGGAQRGRGPQRGRGGGPQRGASRAAGFRRNR